MKRDYDDTGYGTGKYITARGKIKPCNGERTTISGTRAKQGNIRTGINATGKEPL